MPSRGRRAQYHAVTVLFTKSFSDLWLAQASYTWAQLRGNYEGLFNTQGSSALGAPQLDPNINATFDLRTLLANQTGPLPSDITHTIKLYLAKEFAITPVFSTTLGGSFNANSGPPINALGAHPIYGPGQAFILERGGRRAAPLGHLARREDRPQLPAGKGLGHHRRGRGLQPLQFPAAGHGGRELHRRHSHPDPGRQAGQRSDASSAGSAPTRPRPAAPPATAHSPILGSIPIRPPGKRSGSHCRTRTESSPHRWPTSPGARRPTTSRCVSSGSASG